MTDYTKVYDGAAKDTAESVITGADHDVEYDAIETAIATKADKDVPIATNSIGLLDVNGNPLSSEVLISTDGTMAGNSDSAVPTEKAVPTDVSAQTPDTTGRTVMFDQTTLTQYTYSTLNSWVSQIHPAFGTGATHGIFRVRIYVYNNGGTDDIKGLGFMRETGVVISKK